MGLACSQGRAASLVPVRWGCRQWPGGGCGGVSPASTGSASRVEAVVPDRPRRPLWPCPAWLGVRVGSWTPSLSPVSSAAKHSGPLSPESAGRGLPCGRPPPPATPTPQPSASVVSREPWPVFRRVRGAVDGVGRREPLWPLACLCDVRSRGTGQGGVGRTTASVQVSPSLSTAYGWAPGCPEPACPWAVGEPGLRQLLALDLSGESSGLKGLPRAGRPHISLSQSPRRPPC